MTTKMHFGEFNPLEVLATAASLQSVAKSSPDSVSSSESGNVAADKSQSGVESGDSAEADQETSSSDINSTPPKHQPTSVYRIHIKSLPSASSESNHSSHGMGRNTSGSCIVKVVTRNNNNNIQSPKSPTMPTVQDVKRSTVSVDKKLSVDHSYASIQLDRPRADDDEGYVSRSSIDSPGQAWRSDSETQDPDMAYPRDAKSPAILTIKSPLSHRPPSVDIASPLSIESDGSEGLKSPSILSRQSPAHSPCVPITPFTSGLTSPKISPKVMMFKQEGTSDKVDEPRDLLQCNVTEETDGDEKDHSVISEETLQNDENNTTVAEIPQPDVCLLSPRSDISGSETTDVFEKDSEDIEIDVCSDPTEEFDITSSSLLKKADVSFDDGTKNSPEIVCKTSRHSVPKLPLSSSSKTLTVPTARTSVVLQNTTTDVNASKISLRPIKPPSKRSSRKSLVPAAARWPPLLTTPAIKDKMILLPLTTRNQYIIEDDVPPLAKASTGKHSKKTATQSLIPVSRIAGVLVADRSAPGGLIVADGQVSGRAERSDGWEVVGTVNPQGVLSTSAVGTAGTVSIPVAMSSPMPHVIHSNLPSTSGPVILQGRPLPQPPITSATSLQQTLQLTSTGKTTASLVPLKVTAVGLAAQSKSVVLPSPPGKDDCNSITLIDGSIPATITKTGENQDMQHLHLLSSGASFASKDNSSSPQIPSSDGILPPVNAKASDVKDDDDMSLKDGKTCVINEDTMQQSLLSLQSLPQDMRDFSLHEPMVRDRVEDHSDKLDNPDLSSDTESSESETSETASALSVDDDYSRSGFDSGRVTPVNQIDGDKINIKISGSKVIDVTGSGDSSTPVRKASTSIGTVGSLSWTSLGCLSQCESPESDDILTVDTPTGWNLSPSVSSPAMRKLLVSNEPMTSRVKHKPVKESGEGKRDDASARTCHTYVRRKGRGGAQPNVTALADLSRAKQSALLISRLHPLIDHDYCTFADFSADIQSSIIATTETKIRNERKYAKKAKAARTKAVRGIPPPPEKPSRVKRKYVRRKLITPKKEDAENTNTSVEIVPVREKFPIKTEKQSRAEAIKEGKRRAMAERKAKMKVHIIRDKNDKNYVKITGSYQDEFVYFTQKKTGRRHRKSADNADTAQKAQPVGGLIDFDYYKDLSKADKNMRFGIRMSGNSELAVPVPGDNSVKMPVPHSGPGSTPLQDSDVVDLVMDLMPSEQLDVTEVSEETHTILNDFMPSNKMEKSDLNHLAPADETVVSENIIESEDLMRMAEQVRSMINSMDPEVSLKMLENLGDSIKDSSAVDISSTGLKEEIVMSTCDTTSGLNSLLSCPDDQTSPQPVTTNLLDLDDINDNDLIRSDMDNMNMILGDLNTVNKSNATWVGDGGASPLKNYMDSDTETTKDSFVGNVSTPENSGLTYSFDRPLDQSELFPDLSVAGESPAATVTESSVPELTVVSMYWNDMPGLFIKGEQFVRLVDIHKQILPAKDTGILKKRAQMMGLDITNCSELQRDFLIRYANAAKSKSTVIISKTGAQTLIGFYVDPRPRVVKSRSAESKDEDDASDKTSPALTEDASKDDTTDKKGVSRVKDRVVTDRTSTKAEEEDKNNLHTASTPSAATSDIIKDPPKRIGRRKLDVKRSPRLRNKKVQYAVMLQGNYNEVEGSEKPTKVIRMVKGGDDECDDTSPAVPMAVCVSSKEEARRQAFPEELEIRKLRQRQKKRPLSTKDRKRLKQLRERLRKRVLKSKLQDDKVKKVVKVKLKEKPVLTSDKHQQQEHCYAANPEAMASVLPKPAPTQVKQVVIVGEDREFEVAGACTATGGDDAVEVMCEVVLDDEPVDVELPCVDEAETRDPVYEVLSSEALANGVLEVVHRCDPKDTRGQEGLLHLKRLTNRDAPAICCTTCHQFLSIRKFLKHLHQPNSRELVDVHLPHRLEPLSAITSNEQQQLWAQFIKLRTEMEKNKSSPKMTNGLGGGATCFKSDTSLNRKVEKCISTTKPALPVTNTKPVKKKPVAPLPKLPSPAADTSQTGYHQDKLDSSLLSSDDANSPLGGTRHSTRVRKRKQLHPMESYVFSGSAACPRSDTRRSKHDPDFVVSDAKRRN